MTWIQLSRFYRIIPRSLCSEFFCPRKFKLKKNNLMTLTNGKRINVNNKINLKQITFDYENIKKINTRISTNQSKTKTEVPEKKLSTKLQLKQAIKEYGVIIFIFHTTLALISLQICYLLVLKGVDVVALMKSLGVKEEFLSNSSGASTFMIALAVHNIFAPVRISITLGAIPFIAKFLRRKGYLKPKPSSKL